MWLLLLGTAVSNVVIKSTTLVMFAGVQLVKQFNPSHYTYPQRSPFYRLMEKICFGVSPLYAATKAPSFCATQTRQEREFIEAAKDIIKVPNSRVTFVRRWMGAFGALPTVCCYLWDRLDPYTTMPNGVQKKHLLWGLFFLRVYDTEERGAKAVGQVDEKTYREWSFRFVEAISYLESDVVRLFIDHFPWY